MTNETKWTPGPWSIESDVYRNKDASNTIVLTADGAYTVARCGWSIGTEIHSNDEREANAHLIAAAPDLYEALIEAIEAMRALRRLAFTGSRIPVERYPETAQANVADVKARAALAKARGE